MATMHAQALASPPSAALDLTDVTVATRAMVRVATVRLQAMRECGIVVDFTWHSASSAAARLLHCDPKTLIGKRLRDIGAAGPLGHPRLIERYRHILEQGRAHSFEQVHGLMGRQEVVIHRVVSQGDGVTVTLTNLSADRRAQIARLQINALQRGLRRQAR